MALLTSGFASSGIGTENTDVIGSGHYSNRASVLRWLWNVEDALEVSSPDLDLGTSMAVSATESHDPAPESSSTDGGSVVSEDLAPVDQAIRCIGRHFDYEGEVEVFAMDLDDEELIARPETDEKSDGKEN